MDVWWSAIVFFASLAVTGAAYALIRLALGAKEPPDFPSQPQHGPFA